MRETRLSRRSRGTEDLEIRTSGVPEAQFGRGKASSTTKEKQSK